MSAKVYDKVFPPFTRYNQQRMIPPWQGVVLPATEVPLYYLGWMVKSVDVVTRSVELNPLRMQFVEPNWIRHGCQPSNGEDFMRQGLMVPEVVLFGDDHIFFRIAFNSGKAIEYLHTEAGIRTVVRNAHLALGFKEGSFDAYTNLMWVRWPRGDRFPRLKDAFPCVAEHHWVKEEEERHKQELANGAPLLPLAPPEMAAVITQDCLA
ncbi:hypothetical protein NMY22_g15099 [Coprinellus aureogranulatus]|nr:hypothetical protein NMY22_g15099 [Coprinellus aureogranulatus]